MSLNEIQQTQARLSYELAVYREQVSLLKKETDRITLTTMDLNNALRTVEGLGPEEVLVPIGGGAMIRGKVGNSKVLVPIGAGYIMEMDKDGAKSEFEKRIEATKKAIERLNTEYTKVLQRLQEVTGQLRELQTSATIDQQVEENISEDYR
jgi:prefoldin alpha subunit